MKYLIVLITTLFLCSCGPDMTQPAPQQPVYEVPTGETTVATIGDNFYIEIVDTLKIHNRQVFKSYDVDKLRKNDYIHVFQFNGEEIQFTMSSSKHKVLVTHTQFALQGKWGRSIVSLQPFNVTYTCNLKNTITEEKTSLHLATTDGKVVSAKLGGRLYHIKGL